MNCSLLCFQVFKFNKIKFLFSKSYSLSMHVVLLTNVTNFIMHMVFFLKKPNLICASLLLLLHFSFFFSKFSYFWSTFIFFFQSSSSILIDIVIVVKLNHRYFCWYWHFHHWLVMIDALLMGSVWTTCFIILLAHKTYDNYFSFMSIP